MMTGTLLALTSALLTYEAATHAGLTQRVALASRVDQTLRSWGLSDGLLETLRIPMEDLSRRDAFRLRQRLARVDPAWGGAADDRARQRALGWLIAGSVLEETPASRGRHHFLDPRDGSGLEQAGPGLEWLLGAVAAADGEGSLAGMLAGTNSVMRGEPADRWVLSPDNEWSVPVFQERIREAFLAEKASTRGGAMANALLAVGGALHVLQDMASPSHVRNDFVRAHLGRSDGSFFDRSSRYERFVAVAMEQPLPAFESTPPATSLQETFRNLAAHTQNEFFSLGSLPSAVPLVKGTSVDEALAWSASGARYPIPQLLGLDFRRRSGYVSGPHIRHLATYRIDRRDNLRFGLDERCYADQARVLIARAGGASISLLEHLIRPGPAVRIEGGTALVVDATGLGAEAGEVVAFWEDRSGDRRILARRAVGGGALTLGVPGDAVRVGAILDATDAGGERFVSARVVDL